MVASTFGESNGGLNNAQGTRHKVQGTRHQDLRRVQDKGRHLERRLLPRNGSRT